MDLGYFISQVMRFYSMSYTEVIKLPIYTFWELSKNIDRIRADEESHELSILISAIGSAFGGKVKEVFEELHKKRGDIVVSEGQTNVKQNIQLLREIMGGRG